jgi:hypothetical protein
MMSSSSAGSSTVNKRAFASLASCNDHKSDLPIVHRDEHGNQHHDRLVPLVDRIGTLLNRFSHIYDGEQSESKRFDYWRNEAYSLIDNFIEKQRRKFVDSTTDQQRAQLHDMQNILNRFLRNETCLKYDLDEISTNLMSIEQYLDEIERRQLTLPLLTIDNCGVLRLSSQLNELTEIVVHRTTRSSQTIDSSLNIVIDRNDTTRTTIKKQRETLRSSNESFKRCLRHRSRSPRRRHENKRKRK